MQRRHLLTTLSAAALSTAAKAQTLGSVFDPQLNSAIIEVKMPLANILAESPNVLGLPPQVVQALTAGALELRGRFEFNRGARIWRISNFLVPPTTPFPLPQSPQASDPTVGSLYDMAVEHMHWYDFTGTLGIPRRTVTIVGRRLGIYKGTTPLPEEMGVLMFSFNRDNPRELRTLSFAFAGVISAFTTNVTGTLEFDPA